MTEVWLPVFGTNRVQWPLWGSTDARWPGWIVAFAATEAPAFAAAVVEHDRWLNDLGHERRTFVGSDTAWAWREELYTSYEDTLVPFAGPTKRVTITGYWV